MPPLSLLQRGQTFGYESQPWAHDAFALLFAVPRAYEPLVRAWDFRFPGTRKAIDRLTQDGFLKYQPELVVDLRTRQVSSKSASAVARYRATAKGKRLSDAAEEDIRVLHDEFPKLTAASGPRVRQLLAAYVLEPPHSRVGISAPHATAVSGLPERSGRWWTQRLLERGLLSELPHKASDIRQVAPAHWRVTRELARQLREVAQAFPNSAIASLTDEYRLNRTRFLDDIDPARVGITGTTDFDHDIECQLVIAALLKSPRCLPTGVFKVEPRISLPVDPSTDPWEFPGDGDVFYQPDAELRETSSTGVASRSVVEYERFQSRRDAWSHIERFLGWVHLKAHQNEPVVLRFVVDTEPRVRSYVSLIEAFADYCLDFPERLPVNNVVLAVSSVTRVLESSDPLADDSWFRITLPQRADTERRPVLHQGNSPYDDYFGRS